jgi:8-oxo-dGTP diphosphatase
MTSGASMPPPAGSRSGKRAGQLFEFAQKALIVRDGCVLLVRKHDQAPDQGGLWELPGGRVERGEGLDAALCREIREEVGLDISPGPPLAMWTWAAASGAHMISVIRQCEATDFTVSMSGQQASDHLSEFAWVPRDAVYDLDLIADARDSVVEALQMLDR